MSSEETHEVLTKVELKRGEFEYALGFMDGWLITQGVPCKRLLGSKLHDLMTEVSFLSTESQDSSDSDSQRSPSEQ